jgi:hypothetical protein
MVPETEAVSRADSSGEVKEPLGPFVQIDEGRIGPIWTR